MEVNDFQCISGFENQIKLEDARRLRKETTDMTANITQSFHDYKNKSSSNPVTIMQNMDIFGRN